MATLYARKVTHGWWLFTDRECRNLKTRVKADFPLLNTIFIDERAEPTLRPKFVRYEVENLDD